MGICGQCGDLKNKRNDKNKIVYIKDSINCSIQKKTNEICFNFPILEYKPNDCSIEKIVKEKKDEIFEEKKEEIFEEKKEEIFEEKSDEVKIDEEKFDKKENENQKIKNDINKRQYDLRKGKIPLNEEKNDNTELIQTIGKKTFLSNEEIKKKENKALLLEDMCKMGTIMKKEILSKKEKSPEKFFSEEEIIQNKSDEQTYALGIFSKVLENQGITTAIEKNSNNEDSINTAQTTLQFLVNGMSDRSKYDLHFDFGEDKNTQLLNDETARRKFHDKLRKKIAKEYNIKEEDIIITFPRRGSYLVTLIFQSEDFTLETDELLKKFRNEKDELGKLKSIEKGIIMDGCCLSRNMLDPRGNNRDGGWAGKGEKRGKEEYIPPTGWTGYGLKVNDVYEDNIWLGMNNSDGECCLSWSSQRPRTGKSGKNCRNNC